MRISDWSSDVCSSDLSTAAEALAVQERYFDDFEPGQTFNSKGVTLSESPILDFAMLYDPQPFHLDTAAAAEGPLTGLTASGFQTLAVAFLILNNPGLLNTRSIDPPGPAAPRLLGW